MAGIQLRTASLGLAAIVTAVATVLVVLPPDGLFSADCGPKLWQTMAFAQGRGLPRTFDYPAADLDPDRQMTPPFVVAVDSGLVSQYPVLYPVIAALPVRLAGHRMLRLTPLLGGLLAALAAGWTSARIRGRGHPLWTAAGVFATTPLVFYSFTFWEQTTATAMLLIGLAAAAAVAINGRGIAVRWAAVGTAVGVGSWVRTEMLVLAPIVLLPLVLVERRARLRATVASAMAAGGGLALGSLIQRLTLGRWLPMHLAYHSEPIVGESSGLMARLESLVRVVSPDPVTAVASATWLVAVAVVIAPRWRSSRLAILLGLVAVASCGAASFLAPACRWWSGARPTEAFPYAAPAATWFVLAAMPIALWGQSNDDLIDRRRLMLAVTGGWFALTVLAVKPVLSPEWGTRILLPTAVLLAAFQLSFPPARGRWGRLRRVTVAAVAVAAVGVQMMGMVLLQHGVSTHRKLVTELMAHTTGDEPILTDSYLVPLLTGASFGDRKILFCDTPQELRRAAARIGDLGIPRWAFATVERIPSRPLDPGPELTDGVGRTWSRGLRQPSAIPETRLTVAHYTVRMP